MHTRIILLCILLLSSLTCWSQASSDFSNLLNAVNSMQSDFKQTVYDHREKAVMASYGTMAFIRPGKFRWDVKKPIPQLIIANGTKLWIYDADLQQVIIRKLQQAVGETPALLLSHNSTSLDQDFAISEETSKTPGIRWFNLVPRKKEAMFSNIKMGFSNNQIKEMHLNDQLGHKTRIEFKHARVNPNIAASTFEFKAPSHVDVIDETHKKR